MPAGRYRAPTECHTTLQYYHTAGVPVSARPQSHQAACCSFWTFQISDRHEQASDHFDSPTASEPTVRASSVTHVFSLPMWHTRVHLGLCWAGATQETAGGLRERLRPLPTPQSLLHPPGLAQSRCGGGRGGFGWGPQQSGLLEAGGATSALQPLELPQLCLFISVAQQSRFAGCPPAWQAVCLAVRQSAMGMLTSTICLLSGCQAGARSAHLSST